MAAGFWADFGLPCHFFSSRGLVKLLLLSPAFTEIGFKRFHIPLSLLDFLGILARIGRLTEYPPANPSNFCY